jgi:NifU-like protein involved in Fe-S cluster formation
MPDSRYSPQVLEAFRRPRHSGPLAGDSGLMIDGAAGERRTGTEVRFGLRVEQGVLDGVAWGAYGSPYVLAGCELAARELLGRPPDALQSLSAPMLEGLMSAPAERLGELLIIEDALQNSWIAWENRGL